MPRMPLLDGVGAAVVAGAAPPPPPPPPPLRPPIALADMMVGWIGAVWVGMVVGLGAVGKVTVLVEAMVSPGVGLL